MSIRIAIIDDHPSITWGLERLIATEGPRMTVVGCAHDLASARDLLRQSRPDVALLDIDLGGESGIDLLSEFGATPTHFLILTGLRDELAHERAMMAGARGVLSKSAEPGVILRAIDRIHAGELWLDRGRTTRLIDSLRRQAAEATADPFATLTVRERQIVAVAYEFNGATNARLAERLGIAENSLRNALSTIYAKLGVANRLQLFALAARHPPQP